MDYLYPHTRFGTKFKHAKAVDIIIRDTELLSTYLYYWKYSLVTHIMSGKFDCSFKLLHGWNFHQAEF